jgi:hypothetical protein
MDIADFIRARLDEEQANAEHSNTKDQELKDVAARRRHLETTLGWKDADPPMIGLQGGDEMLVLRNLAAKYAAHPDFEPEWQLQD